MTQCEQGKKLGSSTIFRGKKPYVIAEIGVNHEGSKARAKELITAARDSGADAAKFQTYKAETLASRNSPAYWDLNQEATKSQFELFSKYDCFEEDDYIDLADHCAAEGIDFLSTPFSIEEVEIIDPLVSCFKVASADITNVPLLRKIGSCGKPVILSTGASNIDEIRTAIEFLKPVPAANIALLHCVLNYPTSSQNAHLRMIQGLMATFPEHTIGYSDHTEPLHTLSAPLVAVLLGATIIEKHFTLDKTLIGNDHYHAFDPEDMRLFISMTRQALELIGSESEKRALDSEAEARRYARRGLYASRDVQRGEKFTEHNVVSLRPVAGIPASRWFDVLNCTAASWIKAGDPISESNLTYQEIRADLPSNHDELDTH